MCNSLNLTNWKGWHIYQSDKPHVPGGLRQGHFLSCPIGSSCQLVKLAKCVQLYTCFQFTVFVTFAALKSWVICGDQQVSSYVSANPLASVVTKKDASVAIYISAHPPFADRLYRRCNQWGEASIYRMTTGHQGSCRVSTPLLRVGLSGVNEFWRGARSCRVIVM